tara:strand:- start:33 stop:548 length:516 start_codon:yes stop_codon:yes gene_type:complete
MDLIQKIDNLEKERSKLFDDLKSLSGEKLNLQIKGEWSINQHLYHTWLVETTTESYIKTKTKYPDFLVQMSPIAHLKTFILKLFLNLGFKFKAPKIVNTFPEKIDLNELNQNWALSRKSFKKLIEELNNKNLSNLAITRHPLLGRINMHLTLVFFDFHFKHHQNAIIKLKK